LCALENQPNPTQPEYEMNKAKRNARAKRKSRLLSLNKASIEKNGFGIYRGDKQAHELMMLKRANPAGE